MKYAFLSVGGITAAGELVDFHLFEADFARVAMRQAQETWAITDRTKFGRGIRAVAQDDGFSVSTRP